MASNSSDIPVTAPNALLDHEARLEAKEANPDECLEGNQGMELAVYNAGGDDCLEGMELDVYYAAKEGNIDALSEHRERLHQILTPTRNTVLHIYIACAMSTDSKEVDSPAATDTVKTTVKEMLEMCPPLLEQSNKIGDTAIHIAARYGRTAIVEAIMKVAMDRDGGGAWRRILSTINEEGNTALHEAVRFNHFDVVKKLLTTQDDHHDQTFYSANVAGETPLYLAAERGYYELVCDIVKSCTDPAYQGPNGRTALHAAVIRNDDEMTKKLLEHKKGFLAKEEDERGCTPLHLAASLGHTMIVKQLLQQDRSAAYVREKDHKWTALHFAASKGHVDVMKELISQCPDCCELVDEKCRNVLHCSILAKEEAGVVDFVLEDPWLSNILLNGKDDNGNTPLHQIADTSSLRFGTTFETDPRVDKMAFNKANQNAFDILLQSEGDAFYSSTQGRLKDKLGRNGVKPGCRIVSNKKEVDHDVDTVYKKISADDYNKVRESHLVAAILIATVSFTAGFTMPGGYHGDVGSNQGSAVLSRSAAFQIFVITNTIAMTLSSSFVLLHLYSSGNRKRNVMTSEVDESLFALIMLALIAMVIAFITGTYAVLGHYSGLGIAVCVLGFILFFVLVEFMVYDERGIVKMYLPLLPLSLSFVLCCWVALKMFYVCRKLYYWLVTPASEEKMFYVCRKLYYRLVSPASEEKMFYVCRKLYYRLVSPASQGKLSNQTVSNRSSSQVCPADQLDSRQMTVYQQC